MVLMQYTALAGSGFERCSIHIGQLDILEINHDKAEAEAVTSITRYQKQVPARPSETEQH